MPTKLGRNEHFQFWTEGETKLFNTVVDKQCCCSTSLDYLRNQQVVLSRPVKQNQTEVKKMEVDTAGPYRYISLCRTTQLLRNCIRNMALISNKPWDIFQLVKDSLWAKTQKGQRN